MLNEEINESSSLDLSCSHCSEDGRNL